MTLMQVQLAPVAVDVNVSMKDIAATLILRTTSLMRCVAPVVEVQEHTPILGRLVKTQTMERQTHNI